jgi:hypothetical protein
MVHQGDQDGVKGVYHLNRVDEVTQWQVLGAVEQIGEAWLKPALEAALAQFPFQLKGFHSDNGSEFINYRVAAMLHKLFIEQTKSRPRRSNDNGRVESKNGAVVRKHMGYLHIEAQHAEPIQTFYQEHLNPYLNFHRPCGQADMQPDAQGKQRRVYRRYDPVGCLPPTARSSRLSASGANHGSTPEVLSARNRHGVSSTHASGQREALPRLPPGGSACLGADRKAATQKAVEMTGCGKRGKPKPAFPLFPQPLEIAPAIFTFPPPRL